VGGVGFPVVGWGALLIITYPRQRGRLFRARAGLAVGMGADTRSLSPALDCCEVGLRNCGLDAIHASNSARLYRTKVPPTFKYGGPFLRVRQPCRVRALMLYSSSISRSLSCFAMEAMSLFRMVAQRLQVCV
jgi:hypothetical protein